MTLLTSLLRRLALLLALASALPAAAQPTPLQDYDLGPGDLLRITVFQTPDMTTEARVSESGQISFPLIGVINVGGMTTSGTERMIAQRLREANVMQKAQVTVNILQFRSQQVSVLGNVGKPGRYPIEVRGMRLTEVLAAAGGILSIGADTVILLRRDGEKVTRFEIDLPALYIGRQADKDLEVRGGDSVYVHRMPVYYVYGQVQRPGQFTVERHMTVSQAIAKGGGFTLRARENAVRLVRREADGQLREFDAQMSDVVLPDDQLYVRESLF